MTAQVLVVMGSDSDLGAMKAAVKVLRQFGVPHEVHVCSAHRSPAALHDLVHRLESAGLRIIIAGAGAAAHLAGVCASLTTLPVIGVPLEGSAIGGIDSLYSTVQMPGGIPVAAMGIGESGAKNAGLFAVEVLALADPALGARLRVERREMAEAVAKKDAELQKRLPTLFDG